MTDKIEPAVITKVFERRVWIESDMFGSRFVMIQHEGSPAFEFAAINYCYGHTDNSGTMSVAQTLARMVGATDPIEIITRIPKPDCTCRRCQIAKIPYITMPLCPECGDKRCPRAEDHRNSCVNHEGL